MKGSTKKKEDTKELKKSVVSAGTKERELTASEKNILTLWEHEVRGLLSNNYAGFEEAVEAVIDGVLSKLEPGTAKRENTRNFLYEFMTSDPEIISEIKAIFNLN
jgi:hypothetical protein